ncbi:hypothetical protein AVEN_91685-1 [Araneus ventricosus]|uniref:Uncharacterized protein n=1 Tax=Araneus ventricosus TaxID=182803 RepID=A0A4Y2V1L1_ARAVE|nr:hypothetical protein AVEN_91685-1 [Araneus ventricosus]
MLRFLVNSPACADQIPTGSLTATREQEPTAADAMDRSIFPQVNKCRRRPKKLELLIVYSRPCRELRGFKIGLARGCPVDESIFPVNGVARRPRVGFDDLLFHVRVEIQGQEAQITS